MLTGQVAAVKHHLSWIMPAHGALVVRVAVNRSLVTAVGNGAAVRVLLPTKQNNSQLCTLLAVPVALLLQPLYCRGLIGISSHVRLSTTQAGADLRLALTPILIASQKAQEANSYISQA